MWHVNHYYVNSHLNIARFYKHNTNCDGLNTLLEQQIQPLCGKVTKLYKFWCIKTSGYISVLPLLRPAEPVANPLTWAISFCAYSHVISFGRLLSAVSGFSGFIRTYMWLDPGEGTKITWNYIEPFVPVQESCLYMHTIFYIFFQWQSFSQICSCNNWRECLFVPNRILSLWQSAFLPVRGIPLILVLDPLPDTDSISITPFLLKITACCFCILFERKW